MRHVAGLLATSVSLSCGSGGMCDAHCTSFVEVVVQAPFPDGAYSVTFGDQARSARCTVVVSDLVEVEDGCPFRVDLDDEAMVLTLDDASITDAQVLVAEDDGAVWLDEVVPLEVTRRDVCGATCRAAVAEVSAAPG